LTGIRQQDVEGAALFPEVLERLARWSAGFPGLVFCSWGNYDRNQMQQDCAHHRVANPFAGVESINLKTEFARVQGGRKKMGLAEALALAGLPLLGAHHRGIDDARNMARLMPWIVGTRRVAGAG
jgi:inhibitor of KinA sporulation pathway (predicted exonuclease)